MSPSAPPRFAARRHPFTDQLPPAMPQLRLSSCTTLYSALFASLIALACPAPAWAGPVTLGFEELPQDAGSAFLGASYVSAGFRLSTDAAASFMVMAPGRPGYLGSAALMAWGPGSTPGTATLISLERSDGGLFNLDSIDLANPLGHFPVAFEAYDAGGTLLASYTVQAAQISNHFATFDFGDLFHGVARVSWRQGMPDAGVHEFDNVVLEAVEAPAGTVPEPGSLALAGLSLGALALLGRRRGRGSAAGRA